MESMKTIGTIPNHPYIGKQVTTTYNNTYTVESVYVSREPSGEHMELTLSTPTRKSVLARTVPAWVAHMWVKGEVLVDCWED